MHQHHPAYILCYYPLYVLSWVIKQLFHTFLCNPQNYHPLGMLDARCTVAPTLAFSSNESGHPQHLGGDSFDCSTERYEIVVYYHSFGAVDALMREALVLTVA